MPKSLLFLSILLLAFCSFGQNEVVWDVQFDSESESIVFNATIEEGWHLYSQHINEGIGPVATAFTLEPNKSVFKVVGSASEPTPITEYDPNFDGELSYFKDFVQFKQKIKVKSAGEVKGFITYMVCDETKCLPPVDEEFNIKIGDEEK